MLLYAAGHCDTSRLARAVSKATAASKSNMHCPPESRDLTASSKALVEQLARPLQAERCQTFTAWVRGVRTHWGAMPNPQAEFCSAQPEGAPQPQNQTSRPGKTAGELGQSSRSCSHPLRAVCATRGGTAPNRCVPAWRDSTRGRVTLTAVVCLEAVFSTCTLLACIHSR